MSIALKIFFIMHLRAPNRYDDGGLHDSEYKIHLAIAIAHGSTETMPTREPTVSCRAQAPGGLGTPDEPLSTREFAQAVIAAEGWDYEDRDLRLTVTHRIGCMMGWQGRRGTVCRVGVKDAATLWRVG